MIYKVSLPNILYGHLMPPEDALAVSGNIFCVADGITRDPSAPADFRGVDYEKARKNYPNPSGARLVADAFCESFVAALKGGEGSEKEVVAAFKSGNRAIARLNKKNIRKVDFLVNDFWGCVASGGMIVKNNLYWGGLTDCGVIVYNKKGLVKWSSLNWMAPFLKYEKENLEKPDFNFALPEYRRMIRSEYRNNLAKKNISYGALTGEKSAEAFMHFGAIKLAKGDLVVFYTDGFEATVRHKDFFKTIYQKTESLADQKFIPFSLTLARQDYKKFGKERTLIAVIYGI